MVIRSSLRVWKETVITLIKKYLDKRLESQEPRKIILRTVITPTFEKGMWFYSIAAIQTFTIVNRKASVRIPKKVNNNAVKCSATIHIWHGSRDTKYKYKSTENSVASVTCKGTI